MMLMLFLGVGLQINWKTYETNVFWVIYEGSTMIHIHIYVSIYLYKKNFFLNLKPQTIKISINIDKYRHRRAGKEEGEFRFSVADTH